MIFRIQKFRRGQIALPVFWLELRVAAQIFPRPIAASEAIRVMIASAIEPAIVMAPVLLMPAPGTMTHRIRAHLPRSLELEIRPLLYPPNPILMFANGPKKPRFSDL